DGGGNGEAHRAEPTGVDPRVGVVELPVLGAPHLVLTDAGDDDRVVGSVVAQLLDAVLRLEGPVLRLVVVEGVGGLPAADGGVPVGPVRGDGGRFGQLGLDGGGDGLDGRPAVGGDADVGPADLADLGRVEVDVDD